MSFQSAFQHTVGIEGGYSNHPSDSGGETMWGITIGVARAYGYMGPMASMPIITAHDIYRRRYWDLIRLDDVDRLSPPIAAELFDTGVNCGVSIPIPLLQRALNLFNLQGKVYPDLVVDGLAGTVTINALRAYLKKRGALGEKVMLKALNCLQGNRYFEIAERRPKDEDFAFGWFANRID